MALRRGDQAVSKSPVTDCPFSALQKPQDGDSHLRTRLLWNGSAHMTWGGRSRRRRARNRSLTQLSARRRRTSGISGRCSTLGQRAGALLLVRTSSVHAQDACARSWRGAEVAMAHPHVVSARRPRLSSRLRRSRRLEAHTTPDRPRRRSRRPHLLSATPATLAVDPG
jgi:hypothetical protein